MRYVAKFEDDEDGIMVTFPDVPEAITFGLTYEEARKNAGDALVTALASYMIEDLGFPKPRKARGSEETVNISILDMAKLLLLHRVKALGLSQKDLGLRMGSGNLGAQTIGRRLLDFNYGSKIDDVEKALTLLNVPVSLNNELDAPIYNVG